VISHVVVDLLGLAKFLVLFSVW